MDASLVAADAFHRTVDPIFSLLSPEQADQIANFHGDTRLQARIAELAVKANNGDLAREEQAEYEGYAQANRFLAVLKAGVRRLSDPASPSP